jgi:bifunctional UDP-N-acetylglucosamine pyrophosphorylase / glucosamine-1-phosphate N-acetyltransferase
MLVAPLRVGAGATIGAGSTITEDAPDGKLTLARAKQKTVQDWHRPAKGAAIDGTLKPPKKPPKK